MRYETSEAVDMGPRSQIGLLWAENRLAKTKRIQFANTGFF